MYVGKKQSRSRMSLPSEYLLLTLIVALGIALRLYHLQFYLENGGLDSMWYIHAGVNYSNGNWLSPSATWKGPLLTVLLGLSIQFFGSSFMVTKFVSLIAGSLLPVITFLLGSELFGKKVGFLSALIVAINPLLIFYHGLVYREILFSFTWTTSIYFALRGFKGNIVYSIIGGSLLALSSVVIELGIFMWIGFAIYILFERVLNEKQSKKQRYKNLDIFIFSAFLTLVPFIVKNYFTYESPLIQWSDYFKDFTELVPMFYGQETAIFGIYVGLMALSLPLAIMLKRFRAHSRHRKKYSSFPSINLNSRNIKIFLLAFLTVMATAIVLYEFLKGPGPFARLAVGLVKLLQSLAFPESMGFLLIFSIVTMVYTLKSSRDVALIISAFVFSAAGLAWGITTHYLTMTGLQFGQILLYYQWDPLDNAFRYVSSYIPFLAIFACYGIFLFAEKLIDKQFGQIETRAKKAQLIKITFALALVLAILFQFVYADASLRVKAQRDYNSLQEKYEPVVDLLSSMGSPVVYGFNPMLKELYGNDKVVLLNDEGLMEIGRRASNEDIRFIVSDIFGSYSDAQLALYFGGLYDDTSFIGLNRFRLVESFQGWPDVQVFEISKIEATETALVAQHEDWGQAWVTFLSETFLVDVANDKDDLKPYFSGDYKVIVLTELQRSLTNDELNVLRQNVENGATLIISGLAPAYMDLESNGYWIGASDFVEAPQDAKWSVKFTESALTILGDIDIEKNYAFYTSSPYSSPTGLTGIEDSVVVYAEREEGAIAIFAKPYVNGIIIFSGVRPSPVTSAIDYDSYIDFITNIIEKANDKTLFP